MSIRNAGELVAMAREEERARLVGGIRARAEDFRPHDKAIWGAIRDVADMIEGGMGQFAEEPPTEPHGDALGEKP